jgi:hypothetical protein
VAGLLAVGAIDAASPMPGVCVLADLVLVAGDDAPDDPDTVGLVTGSAGAWVVGALVAGALVAGALVAGAWVAGAWVAGAWVAGALVAGALVAGALVVGASVVGASVVGASVVGVVDGSLDAEADAGWAGVVDGGVGPVHILLLTR